MPGYQRMKVWIPVLSFSCLTTERWGSPDHSNSNTPFPYSILRRVAAPFHNYPKIWPPSIHKVCPASAPVLPRHRRLAGHLLSDQMILPSLPTWYDPHLSVPLVPNNIPFFVFGVRQFLKLPLCPQHP